MPHIHENSVGATTFALPWTYIAGGAAAITAFALLSKALAGNSTHKNGLPLPPGPPATWFWENPMPKQNVAKRLGALVEQYGPIISLRRGSHLTIVIGRMDAATEIMEKEGAVLIDRPRMIPLDILSGGMNLLPLCAGDEFRRRRRAVHTHLQPKAAEKYEDIQTKTAKDAIQAVLNDPKQHIGHAQRYAAAVMLRVTYGMLSPTSSDDPELVRIRQALDNFRTVMRPGAYLVNHVPWLRHVPGYGRELKEFHRFELALFRDQLNRVREDKAMNRAGPSFGKTLLEHADDHRLSDDEMAYLAGGLFSAGSETTAIGITVMIMAAACYPDAQARVQEELDEVVGKTRIPTFEDWDMLPQLHAFMLEALRWRPITPLGFEHRAMKDIVWRGQCIPAGATVLGCHWAISRDPVVFPNPEMFDPGRWLTEDGRVRVDLRFYTYGFGRRVCPGQHVANRSLYINLALLLWSFRILERPEAPIDLSLGGAQEESVVFDPHPFEVEFVPRVEEKRLRELMT